MKRELISVVVPVYNVEKYLNRCIESITGQTYTDLEIILVDDGSPDKCPQLCDEWEQKDERIKVIHKANAGLGMARNTGIENANGKYVFFCDSDDYISLETIEKAYESAKKHNSDIVIFGLCSVDADGNISNSYIPRTDKEEYSGTEILEFILPNMIASDPNTGKQYNLNMSASGSLFSLDLIKYYGWRFVSEREVISEDFYSLLELYRYVKRVSIVREALYYYCVNGNSLSHTYSEGRLNRICDCHALMVEKCANNNYPISVKMNVDSQFIGSVIADMKLRIKTTRDKKIQKKLIKDAVNNAYLQNMIRIMNVTRETKVRKVFLFLLKRKYSLIIFWLVSSKC